MKTTKVGINGLGRIGRAFFALASHEKDLEIVAINDLADAETLAYLLKYDSVYGKKDFEVMAEDGALHVDGKEIKLTHIKDPAEIPWGEMEIDVVVEATGVFASYEKASAHLQGGAKRIVISAPVKDEAPEGLTGETVLMGVNDDKLQTCDISSNASCTTNAGGPVVQILDEALGIEKAILNTIHGYTSTQSLVDGPHKKDMRKGRAAAINMIPATTGAAIATTLVVPSLTDKFDGIAVRVPVPAGSLADITFISKKETTVEEVNDILSEAADSDRWEKTFSVTGDPIVSSDIVGQEYGSIVDLSFTRVVDGNLVKVLAWYDNEMGYARTLVEHVKETGKYI